MSEAQPPSEPQSQAPHPVLPEYYERADQRRKFLREIFDRTASDYDATERLFSFGTGSGYRRMALRRAGLDTGMHVLDVAVGTGLVAREALHVVGARGLVVGVDPSWGMLSSAPQVAAMPLVQGGRLKAIAVSSSGRSLVLPQLPTVAEQGFPGFQSTAWDGMVAPAKTPSAIVGRLSSELVRIIRSDEVHSRMLALYFQAIGTAPEGLANLMREEVERWGKVIRQTGAKAD